MLTVSSRSKQPSGSEIEYILKQMGRGLKVRRKAFKIMGVSAKYAFLLCYFNIPTLKVCLFNVCKLNRSLGSLRRYVIGIPPKDS